MEFLAKIISGIAENTVATPYTTWWVWDEPECPEELI